MIAMTIVVMIGVMMVSIFNTMGVGARGRDAQRKKDLRRIKIAFEEYFNDKGIFPDPSWNTIDNCGSRTVFAPYLVPWPCDPNGEIYEIVVAVNEFRVITNLEYKKDKDIPDGWYLRGDNYRLYDWTVNDVNYGVSSANILWYDGATIDYSMCNKSVCLNNVSGTCSHRANNQGCNDNFCYYWDNTDGGSCTSNCKTTCCGNNCPN